MRFRCTTTGIQKGKLGSCFLFTLFSSSSSSISFSFLFPVFLSSYRVNIGNYRRSFSKHFLLLANCLLINFFLICSGNSGNSNRETFSLTHYEFFFVSRMNKRRNFLKKRSKVKIYSSFRSFSSPWNFCRFFKVKRNCLWNFFSDVFMKSLHPRLPPTLFSSFYKTHY